MTDSTNLPLPGEIWRHYKGGRYKVLYLSRHTEDGTVVVVYQSIKYGTVWTRPLSVWTSPVTETNGVVVTYTPRFIKEHK